MKMNAGLWIDHRKAMIVTITDKGQESRLIISKVEKHSRRSGDRPLAGPYESQQVPESDSRQKKFTGHLNIYYDAVIACIRGAQEILILGPGEAKGELKKRLKKNNLDGRIVAMETVDKMTAQQVAARVGRHFAE